MTLFCHLEGYPMTDEHNNEKFEDYEEESAYDVAFLAHHKIDTLIEVLIEKGIITEEEIRKKSEELSVVDEESDEEDI